VFRGSNPSGGEISGTRPDRHLGPPSLLYNWYRVSFQGVKRPGRGVDHPPHLAPRLKKEYSYTSAPPLGLRGLLQGELYLYFTLGPTICRFPRDALPKFSTHLLPPPFYALTVPSLSVLTMPCQLCKLRNFTSCNYLKLISRIKSVARRVDWLMNNELEETWKEATVPLFSVVIRLLIRGLEL